MSNRRNMTLLFLSMVVIMLGFGMIIPIVPFYVTVLLATCFFVFSNAMLNPSVATHLSRRSGHEQGAAVGLNSSFLSLGRIIGPLWAGLMLDVNLCLPYLSGAVVMAFGFVTTLVWGKGRMAPVEPVVAGSP